MAETTTASEVQYKKDQDGLRFMQARIQAAINKVRNRINVNERAATEEERELLENYKASATALSKYVAKKGVTPLTLTERGGKSVTGVPVVSENFLTNVVVGSREEQIAAAEEFKKKNEQDIAALEKALDDLNVAFYTQSSGVDLSGPLADALGKLKALNLE